MKTLLSSALALSVVFGLGTSVGIADHKDKGKNIEAWIRFKELDANISGELSFREFKRHLEDDEVNRARLLFDRYDRNRNNSVSFSEFKVGPLR